MANGSEDSSQSRYKALIEKIFFGNFRKGAKEVAFEREDLPRAAKALDIQLPKILRTQPKGMEWVIEGVGRSRYIFRLVKINRVVPNAGLLTIKIPDATPEIVSAYALSDEQSLLAKVRYNRLVDVFLGIATYSLQNHLRTTVKGIGQIEIDEMYVGVASRGRQYVLPVQAKGGNDQLSVVQTKQDIACCAEKFPGLICRSISAQFMADDLIAMFELTQHDGEIRIVEEKHYRLVPSDQISISDLKSYGKSVL